MRERLALLSFFAAVSLLPSARAAELGQQPASKTGDCLTCSDSAPAPKLPGEVTECLPLGPGEWKIVSTRNPHPVAKNWGASGTTEFQVHHRVTRLKEPHPETGKPYFDFEIPIRFVRPRVGDAPATRLEPEADARLRSEANRCFDRASRWLRGPGGEHVRLRLAEETATAEFRTVTVAREGEPESRGNAYYWMAGWECSTWVHETLHLLGLADEYEEDWMGYLLDDAGNVVKEVDDRPKQLPPGVKYVPKYSCRAIGPSGSVMKDHYSALGMLDAYADYLRCVCRGSFCEPILRAFEVSPNPNRCSGPGRSVMKETRKLGSYSENLKARFRAGTGFREELPGKGPGGIASWMLPAKATPPSDPNFTALLPAHFRVLTQPAACDEKVRDYHQCAATAYETPKPGKGCPPLPPACANGSMKWLTQ